MSSVSTTSRTKIYIGNKLPLKSSDYTKSEIEAALTAAVPVGFLENLGTFGDEGTEVTFDAIDSGRTMKLKGTRNAGNIALVAGLNESDPGQAALIAAEKTDDNYAIKIEWNDAPAGGTPTTRLFIGIIMSASEAYDSVNNVKKLNATIAINSNIVKAAASATPPVAPAFSVDPSISGAGATKTGAIGTFSGTMPVSISTRWKLDGNIVATNVTSFDTTGLVGDLVFEVTLSNAAGSLTRASAPETLS